MRRRVVVTGMGCINPLGHDVPTVWKALQEGRSGVALTTIFDASSFPTKIAAEIKDWSPACVGQDVERWSRRGRHSQFAAAAALQAVGGSGVLNAQLDPTRLGVYLGSGEGTQDFASFTRMMSAAVTGGGLDLAELTRVGLEILEPAGGIGAGAQHAVGAPGRHVQRTRS